MLVSVFDPHPVIHKGLTRLLPDNGFSVVSLSLDGRNALQTIRDSRAQIVITEVRMPHVDGLKLLDVIQDAVQESEVPAIKTIIYTSDTNPTNVARAVALGAHDYILKTEPVECLTGALNSVSGRPTNDSIEPTYDRNTLFADIGFQLQATDIVRGNAKSLTNREAQVLRHLGFGLSNREIARSLKISVETVKEHVQNILRKLDCNDRTAAAVWAVREGIS